MAAFFFVVFFQVGCNTLDLGFHLREARTLKLSADKNINKISHAHFPAPSPGLHSPDPALIFLVSQYPGDEGGRWGVVLLCHAYRSLSPTAPGDPPSDHELIKKKFLVRSSRGLIFFFFFSAVAFRMEDLVTFS